MEKKSRMRRSHIRRRSRRRRSRFRTDAGRTTTSSFKSSKLSSLCPPSDQVSKSFPWSRDASKGISQLLKQVVDTGWLKIASSYTQHEEKRRASSIDREEEISQRKRTLSDEDIVKVDSLLPDSRHIKPNPDFQLTESLLKLLDGIRRTVIYSYGIWCPDVFLLTQGSTNATSDFDVSVGHPTNPSEIATEIHNTLRKNFFKLSAAMACDTNIYVTPNVMIGPGVDNTKSGAPRPEWIDGGQISTIVALSNDELKKAEKYLGFVCPFGTMEGEDFASFSIWRKTLIEAKQLHLEHLFHKTQEELQEIVKKLSPRPSIAQKLKATLTPKRSSSVNIGDTVNMVAKAKGEGAPMEIGTTPPPPSHRVSNLGSPDVQQVSRFYTMIDCFRDMLNSLALPSCTPVEYLKKMILVNTRAEEAYFLNVTLIASVSLMKDEKLKTSKGRKVKEVLKPTDFYLSSLENLCDWHHHMSPPRNKLEATLIEDKRIMELDSSAIPNNQTEIEERKSLKQASMRSLKEAHLGFRLANVKYSKYIKRHLFCILNITGPSSPPLQLLLEKEDTAKATEWYEKVKALVEIRGDKDVLQDEEKLETFLAYEKVLEEMKKYKSGILLDFGKFSELLKRSK